MALLYGVLMMNIKNILLKVLYKNNFLKYAQKAGVNFPEGTDGIKLCSNKFGSEPWLVFIGKHVELSGNVTFITHDGSTWVFRNQDKYKKVIRFGAIRIKENCFIGMNATILPNVTIGPDAIVGAGSIVTKDVPPGAIVAGNPARIIGRVDDFAEKCLRETPEYDIDNLKKNKKGEVLRAYGYTK